MWQDNHVIFYSILSSRPILKSNKQISSTVLSGGILQTFSKYKEQA